MNIAVAETRILDNEVFNNPEHKHTFKKNMFFLILKIVHLGTQF